MKQIYLLTKAYISGATFISKGRRVELKAQKQGWIVPLALVSIIAAAISFGILLVINYKAIFRLGAALGYPELLLVLALLMSWILTLIFSTISVLTILYRSKDLNLLITLPVSTHAIVASRLLLVYVSQLVLHCFLVIPAVVIYLQIMGFSVGKVIGSIIFIVIGPLLPISISSLCMAGLVRNSSRSRHKVAVEVITLLLVLVVFIGMQALFQNSVNGQSFTEESAVYQFITTKIEALYNSFPPAVWISNLVSGNSASAAALGVVCLAAVSCIAVFSTSRKYTVILSQEVGIAGTIPGNHRSVSSKSGSNSADMVSGKVSPVWKALLKREFSIISSSSAFIIETFGEVLIPVILLLVYFVTGTVGELESYIDVFISHPMFPMIVFGVLLLMSSISTVSASSISREGPMFWLNKVLPIKASVQIDAKLLFHMLLFYPGFVIYSAIAVFGIGYSPLHLIYMLPAGFAIIATSAYIGLYIDLLRPLLNWSNPQQAMKQNMNVLIAMGINAAHLVILGGLVYLVNLLGVSIYIIGLCIAVIELSLFALVRKPVLEIAYKRYSGALG